MRKPPSRKSSPRRSPPKKDRPDKLIRGSWKIKHEDMENAYRVTEKAKDEMIRRGIKMPERPSTKDSDFTDRDGFPHMPENLMDLSNNDLGELYSIIGAWQTYIVGQVAEAEVKHKEVSKHKKLVESKVRLQQAGLKNSADKTAATETDVRYVSANEEEIESEAFLVLLRNAADNMEANRKIISRIISLRDQEVRSGSRLAGIRSSNAFRNHMPDVLTEVRDVDVPPPRTRRSPPSRPSRLSKRRKR